MSAYYTESEARTIRGFVRERRRRRRAELALRLEAARRDFDAVAAMVVRTYKPRRVYQWGSLLEESHFSEMSDIDLAVEGIDDPATLSKLRVDSEGLTDFPLDIVAMEHIHPAYAEYIRRHGRVVYER
ncbi:MAG: hypothetical protein JW820_05515 [Spirochaetales bacterium]|nr:hypothetical protein [Spirochaetales bacterium]